LHHGLLGILLLMRSSSSFLSAFLRLPLVL
jgi:hypothetical protein